MIKLEMEVHGGTPDNFPEVYKALVNAISSLGLGCTIEATIHG